MIIAHETVLRLLYGYLMEMSIDKIPFMDFPKNSVIQLSPKIYGYEEVRLLVD